MSATKIAALAIASVIVLQGNAASAQPPLGDERTQYRRAAEHNQLGILEYCQAQGMVDEVFVSAQREMIRRLPESQMAMTGGSPDEAAGRAGFLSFGSRQARFDDSAAAQGVTLRTACEVRAAMVPTKASQ